MKEENESLKEENKNFKKEIKNLKRKHTLEMKELKKRKKK